MALVRVKRRAQDDPIDVLLLASKKLRTEEDVQPVSNVFRFLATVEKEEDNINEHLDHAKKTIPKRKVTFRHNDLSTITEKLRSENKLFSQNNRLKVINCFRAIHSSGEEDMSDVTSYTVVDIENAPIHEESKDSNSSNSMTTAEQYVYDLYYAHNTSDFSDIQLEHALSAHEVDEKLLFGQDVSDHEDINCDDDDDSNDENNWRNDYPDEEDVFRDEEEEAENSEKSIDEDDMRDAVQKMKSVKINGDYLSDLSSDNDDEELIYGIPDDMKYYNQAVYDDSDDNMY